MRVPILATTTLLLLCHVAGAGSAVSAHDGKRGELRGREMQATCDQSECIQDPTVYATQAEAIAQLGDAGGYLTSNAECSSGHESAVGSNPDQMGGTGNLVGSSCADAGKFGIWEQDCKDRADLEGVTYQQTLTPNSDFPSGCWRFWSMGGIGSARYYYNAYVGTTTRDCESSEIFTCACCNHYVGHKACSCPVIDSPAPSPPPPVPPHLVADECSGNGGASTPTPICVDDPEGTEVAVSARPPASEYTPAFDWVIKTRCCHLTRPATFCESQNSATNVCYGSAQTWAEAQQTCANDGRRLCTVAELSNCCNTGCNYDNWLVWSEDECLEPPSPPPPLPSPPPPSPPPPLPSPPPPSPPPPSPSPPPPSPPPPSPSPSPPPPSPSPPPPSPSPPPSPPAPPPTGDEWYLGAHGQNCNQVCAAGGQVCDNLLGRARQPDTDTKAKFLALLDTIRDNHRYLGTIPLPTFACNTYETKRWSQNPSITPSLGLCTSSVAIDHDPGPNHGCSSTPDNTVQRLCLCQWTSPSTPPSTPPPPPSPMPPFMPAVDPDPTGDPVYLEGWYWSTRSDQGTDPNTCDAACTHYGLLCDQELGAVHARRARPRVHRQLRHAAGGRRARRVSGHRRPGQHQLGPRVRPRLERGGRKRPVPGGQRRLRVGRVGDPVAHPLVPGQRGRLLNSSDKRHGDVQLCLQLVAGPSAQAPAVLLHSATLAAVTAIAAAADPLERLQCGAGRNARRVDREPSA